MKRFLAVLAIVAFFAGCVPVDSLNPLYADKDIVFDASLLGEWVDPGATDDGSLKFNKEGDNAYQIIMTETNGGEVKRTFYHGHLVAIGNYRFLDIVPQNWEARRDSYVLHLGQTKDGSKIQPRLLKLGEAAYMEFTGDNADAKGAKLRAQLRPAHWFLKVQTDGKKLRLSFIDDDNFRKAIEQGKFHIGNALLGDGKARDVVLTADTKELQKFILDHANDEALFAAHLDELQRKP